VPWIPNLETEPDGGNSRGFPPSSKDGDEKQQRRGELQPHPAPRAAPATVQGWCDPRVQNHSPSTPSPPQDRFISWLRHKIIKKILPGVAFPVCLEANHLIRHMQQFSV